MTTQRTDSPSRLAGHLLVEALLAQGVDTVFGVPGDAQYQPTVGYVPGSDSLVMRESWC